ncbi:hypothetical protein F5144DRAFT_624658 [Chaetomium tenue]|uniref:Uncharacterized protein n=1 Tax=Chaetomium tenue TaxID=1854479 RepID=A0ACB7PKQ0_9PEZI|nr:hypothetical protein F5144DRAFT_624658 [Chaetomium globosum]
MQLSSLFLSATSLLAQAASAKWILAASDPRLQPYPVAKVQADTEPAPIGFTLSTNRPLAEITIGYGGDIGPDFYLRQMDSGMFMLLKGEGAIDDESDTTGPFAVKDGLFVFDAEGVRDDLEWVTCEDEYHHFDIYLDFKSNADTRDSACKPTDLRAFERN